MSSKTRFTLRKKAKKLAESVGGELEMTRIDSEFQVGDFLANAVRVSRNSWQHEILGNRISDSEDERAWVQRLARAGLLRNYLLKCGGRSCAFVVGYQFNGVFQDQFKELPSASQTLICAGLFFLVVAVALLIAPSMQHRIVERGQDSPRILALATLFAGTALLPISIALALDVFVAMERIFLISIAILAGAVFFVLALLCWYMLEWIVKRKGQPMSQQDPPKPRPGELLVKVRVCGVCGSVFNVSCCSSSARRGPTSFGFGGGKTAPA